MIMEERLALDHIFAQYEAGWTGKINCDWTNKLLTVNDYAVVMNDKNKDYVLKKVEEQHNFNRFGWYVLYGKYYRCGYDITISKKFIWE